MIRLIKYRNFNCEKPLALFDSFEITFKTADQFNDPFDSAMIFDKKTVIDELINDDKFLSSFYKYIYFEENKKNPNYGEIKDFINEAKSSNLMKQSIYDNAVNAIEFIRKEYSVCCFSSEVEDPQLWGVYADCGRGFAVEYDYDDVLKQSTIYARKIGFQGDVINKYIDYGRNSDQTILLIDIIKTVYEYLEEKQTIRYEISGSTEYVDIFFTKYDRWKYENEYRFVIPNIFASTYTNIQLSKVKCVYMGYNISKENENKLIEICQRNKIDLYKMKVVFGAKEPKLIYTHLEANLHTNEG